MGSCKNIGNLRLSGPTDFRKRTGKKKKGEMVLACSKGFRKNSEQGEVGGYYQYKK